MTQDDTNNVASAPVLQTLSPRTTCTARPICVTIADAIQRSMGIASRALLPHCARLQLLSGSGRRQRFYLYSFPFAFYLSSSLFALLCAAIIASIPAGCSCIQSGREKQVSHYSCHGGMPMTDDLKHRDNNNNNNNNHFVPRDTTCYQLRVSSPVRGELELAIPLRNNPFHPRNPAR